MLALVDTLACALSSSLDLLTIPRGASLANDCAAVSGAWAWFRRLMAGAEFEFRLSSSLSRAAMLAISTICILSLAQDIELQDRIGAGGTPADFVV